MGGSAGRTKVGRAGEMMCEAASEMAGETAAGAIGGERMVERMVERTGASQPARDAWTTCRRAWQRRLARQRRGPRAMPAPCVWTACTSETALSLSLAPVAAATAPMAAGQRWRPLDEPARYEMAESVCRPASRPSPCRPAQWRLCSACRTTDAMVRCRSARRARRSLGCARQGCALRHSWVPEQRGAFERSFGCCRCCYHAGHPDALKAAAGPWWATALLNGTAAAAAAEAGVGA